MVLDTNLYGPTKKTRIFINFNWNQFRRCLLASVWSESESGVAFGVRMERQCKVGLGDSPREMLFLKKFLIFFLVEKVANIDSQESPDKKPQIRSIETQ